MKQRKQIGVEKVLQDSDSELDENMENKIDKMVENRERQQDEERKIALQNSFLAKRKLLNMRTKAPSADTLKQNQSANRNKFTKEQMQFLSKRGVGKDQIKIITGEGQPVSIARKFLNERMRAMRFEQEITGLAPNASYTS